MVAVATGDGVGRIFRSLGVQGLIAGGQSMNPSTAELVDAVQALRSDEVIILPNNGNIRAVAERVDDLTDKSVWVVPTDTVVAGFAALLAYDPGAHGPVNARSMEASPQGGHWRGDPGRARLGQSRVRSPRATGWDCPRGIEVVDDSLAGAACSLLDVLVTDPRPGHHHRGGGVGSGRHQADHRVDQGSAAHIEMEVHHGGQPLYPYLFSIE